MDTGDYTADYNAAAASFTGFPLPTLVTLIWTAIATIWSIFTPPHKTFAARVLLFQPLWFVREYLGDGHVVQDLALFLALHSVYGLYVGSWSFISPRIVLDHFRLDDEVVQTYLKIFALLGSSGLLASLTVIRGKQLQTTEKSELHLVEQSIDESLLPPLLIPSRTTHSRIFPRKHSFSYSYLFVGISVGIKGRLGGVLSVDSKQRAWFDVRSADYLDRGEAQHGLGEKLQRYLRSQGVTDSDYAFAYLVTAPRFLGYSFNPVSFWYIYDEDTVLKYMVLEVNNTFDERRMYLLKADNAKVDPDLETTAKIDSTGGKTAVFTDVWTKDFHVSPFNSRKGSYSLQAVDPLAALEETGKVRIDNTIVLRSSGNHAKIVARVFSEGAPLSPSEVRPLQLTSFILSWWWVGLMTFPRILWEAQKLFIRRGLHVWYKPEVTDTSIGRTYTDDEWELEFFFRSFLSNAVENARKPLRVIYEPPHNERKEIVLYSPGFSAKAAKERTLTVKVLSPGFYSRFIHYAHAKEAIDRECLATDEKNRTLVIDNPMLLLDLLDAIKEADEKTQLRHSRTTSVLDRLRWSMLRKARCPPAAVSYPSSSVADAKSREYRVQDIRAKRLSELDRHVQQHTDSSEIYRRIAIKSFLSERLGFGVPGLVSLFDFIIRATLLLTAIIVADRVEVYDILRSRSFDKDQDLIPGVVVLGLANAVHLWSLAKG